MKFYAGIGSRQTPGDVLSLMSRLATCLAREGWTLRSGGAQGADTAFWQGAMKVPGQIAEVFVPWRGFGHDGEWPISTHYQYGASVEAQRIAAKFHPAWERLASTVRLLHGRNTHQVLGINCTTPSKFICCWTPGANSGGGTGQAIRIAKAHGIEVFDLADPTIRARIEAWVNEMEAN